MSQEETTLELDTDRERTREGPRTVVRVALARAQGFTRDGGSPTLCRSCPEAHGFDREIDRLVAELDDLRAQGRAALEGRALERKAEAPLAAAQAATPRAARFEPGLTVRDAMTRPVRTLHRNDPISVADELMKVGRFRHVVVLDDDDRVAGVVSHRDIFHGAVAWTFGIGKNAHDKALQANPVKEVMQTQISTAAPGDPLEEAARRMLEQKIGCLPVLDGEDLVGILTDGDLLALVAGTHAGS